MFADQAKRRWKFSPTQEVWLSPNPAGAEAMLSINRFKSRQQYSLKLSNLEGKTVLRKRLIAPNNPLQISHLKKGIYLYEVWENDGLLESGKFIKK